MTTAAASKTGGRDAPTQPAPIATNPKNLEKVLDLDIEHAIVEDDPREWSRKRKKFTLAMIACAAMIATLGANIYNPAIKQIMEDLSANDAEVALSLSLFIVVQGGVPILWAAFSEIKGRKLTYLVSLSINTLACVICGISKSIGLLIGMRVLQASGGAAVLTIGAGTLADIFDTAERGTMLGIYYAAPLLGPALGPLVGGVLTQAWNWRATFYFLAAVSGAILLLFTIFKDSFRRERSTAYQAVVRRHRAKELKKMSTAPTSPNIGTPRHNAASGRTSHDLEQVSSKLATLSPPVEEIQLNFRDINPFPQFINVLKRKNNITILVPSGILFGFAYSITYTCSKTLFDAPYNYNALHVGLVLLSFGLGSMAGSVLGGRWSDYTLARMKKAHGGQSHAEMRLESTKICMPFLPMSVLAYAWLADKHVHIAAIVAALFFAGFTSIWIYSSTLAYIVDANPGRSSVAVATNSMFRGCSGFIAAEIAVPLQIAIGDGGLYTIWAVICVVLDLAILLTILKGGAWREQADVKEKEKSSRQS